MGIQIQDLIKDMALSVNRAYEELREENIAVSLPEIEVTLDLEVELEGQITAGATVIGGEQLLDYNPEEMTVRRSVMDEAAFKESGIVFSTIGTAHTADKELKNITLRIAFTPSERSEVK